jgi:hypothetical protein
MKKAHLIIFALNVPFPINKRFILISYSNHIFIVYGKFGKIIDTPVTVQFNINIEKR